MTKADVAELNRVLKATEATVEEVLRHRDGIRVERSPDASDETRFGVDRELSTRALDRESRLLSAIRLALRRLEEGDYGICERCQGAIGPRRLAAVPWTCYCLRCQEWIESEREDHDVPVAA